MPPFSGGNEVQRYDIASPRQTDSGESLSCRFPCGFRINGFFTEKVLGFALQPLKWIKSAVTLQASGHVCLCPRDTVPKVRVGASF